MRQKVDSPPSRGQIAAFRTDGKPASSYAGAVRITKLEQATGEFNDGTNDDQASGGVETAADHETRSRRHSDRHEPRRQLRLGSYWDT